MEINYIILSIYSLLWTALLSIYYSIKRVLDAGTFIILCFTALSFISIIYYHQLPYSLKEQELTLFPLLYLFVSIILCILPLLNKDYVSLKILNNRKIYILDIVATLFIISVLVALPFNIIYIKENLLKIIIDQTAGQELYQDSLEKSMTNDGVGKISNIFAIYSNAFIEISIFILFLNFSLKRRKTLNKFLIISIFFIPLSVIANGQRTSVILPILAFTGTYFLFRFFLPQNINKKIKIYGSILGIILLIPIIALTISRFGNSDAGTGQSVISYAGQSTINFDKYAFDNNGIRYGDRTFPLVKQICGFDNVPKDFWERRDKYPKLKINDEVFVNFIGDFVLDFGPIISFLMIILFSIITLKMTILKKRKISIAQLLILHYLMMVSIEGSFYLYPFADTAGLKVFIYIALYLIFTIKIGHKKHLNESTQFFQ